MGIMNLVQITGEHTHFMKETKLGTAAPAFTPRLFKSYHWPVNAWGMRDQAEFCIPSGASLKKQIYSGTKARQNRKPSTTKNKTNANAPRGFFSESDFVIFIRAAADLSVKKSLSFL
jgi:hypothetical protein